MVVVGDLISEIRFSRLKSTVNSLHWVWNRTYEHYILIDRNSYSSMHIAHQSDFLHLPFPSNSTNFYTMVTRLLMGSPVLLLSSFLPKNLHNNFCCLGHFLSPIFPPPLCHCEFAAMERMETSVEASTSS